MNDTNESINSDKGLKVLSLCGGVETGLYALQKLGISISEYHTYEILPEAIAVSQYHYPFIVHHGDLYEADFSNYIGFDLLLAGTCCFGGDELVLTDNGYKKISEIQIGDLVFTHKSRYKKVINKFWLGKKKTITISSMQSSQIECTDDHKFLIRKMYREWDSDTKTCTRKFTSPKWEKAQNLKRGDYVGTPINCIEEYPSYYGCKKKLNQFNETIVNELQSKMKLPQFWKFVGRFIGDGWVTEYNTKRQDGRNRHVLRTILCCSHQEKNELEKIIKDAEFRYSISKHRTTYEFQIANYELSMYLLQFGKGAPNKHLTKDILNLPSKLLKEFLDGYLSADGCYIDKKNIYQFTTTSERLAFEISLCWNKVYKLHTSITHHNSPDKYIIEDRIINQKDIYIVRCPCERKKQDKAFYESGFIWSPFRKIDSNDGCQDVYDLEVEDDHSYIINNIVAHNCQSLSRLRCDNKDICNGLDGKSGIFYKAVEALHIINPKYFMFENVIPSNKEDLDEMTRCIGVNPILIDSGIFSAQNRERYYWTNIPLKELPKGSLLVLQDIMENIVNEKYFYKKDFRVIDMKKRVCGELLVNTTEMCRRIYNPKFKCSTLTCVSGGYQEKKVMNHGRPRKLTETEYERLQGLPDGYTDVLVNGRKLSYSKRCSLMGNGWNEPTVEWILSGLKENI